MGTFDELLKDAVLPEFVKVKQEIVKEHVPSVEDAVLQALEQANVLSRIKEGDSVCIAVGSREIANIKDIAACMVQAVKKVGGNPFLVPAMGSHGGATAPGQLEILDGFGITEQSVGAPIKASMQTVQVAQTAAGLPVHMDSYASEADCIIPIARVKPHTDFRGPIESGLMKMLAVGLGKQKGASICHQLGFPSMSQNVQDLANAMIKAKPVIFALGVIENAQHETYKVIAVPAERIALDEPALLEEAKSLLPRIPFDKADILVVGAIGKDISGAGMDSFVTGRSASLGVWEPFFERIAVLDVTDESHNNATGIGNADATTQRAFEKFDFEMTYPNALTCRDSMGFKIPPVMPNDKLAIQFCLQICTEIDPQIGPRIVWIKDTLHLSEYYISKQLLPQAKKSPILSVVGQPLQMPFDHANNCPADIWDTE